MGSQFAMTENNGSRVEITVTEWYPPIRCAYRIEWPDTGTSQDFHVNFAVIGDGTRLEMMGDMQLGGPNRVVIPVMAPALRHWFYPRAIKHVAEHAEARRSADTMA